MKTTRPIRDLPRLADPDANLAETMRVLRERRRVLALLGSAGLCAVLPRSPLACTLIPQETEGPYPGDGTNGPNALAASGIVRSDIRSSVGVANPATAAGAPLTFALQFLSTLDDCGPIEGLAVYAWHCDAQGRYSMYSQGVTGQNYLRGVQTTDGSGRVSFTTVFPGCYPGRWPHIHFEVFASLADATSGRNAGRVSQLALPEAACTEVYAQSARYPGSAGNLGRITLTSDNVFGDDGGVHQLAAASGNPTDGYAAFLEVGLSVDATTSELIFVDDFDP
ncbi:intradiol ring-cleavage dioxygenase [Dokdonella sp.]|uniref:intradiol ring-cleavage dioxygenase n=1 Tax=Dokdonella sp. TaxID=2291710 RepID=UPI001AFD95E7|nr:intradiol ring-cleavage dioxygenase [Dokdonella sp.]MBO9663298.1 intradiol ring-cleavage dioxygenase [Dokdonella sp.]